MSFLQLSHLHDSSNAGRFQRERQDCLKHRLLVLIFIGAVNVAVATAQVSISGQASKDESASAEQITISTMDRSFVPLVIENKLTKVDENTTRSESAARARLNDGSYFDWRTVVAVERQIDSNHTEVFQNLVEKDRQGNTRTTLQINLEVVKTPDGEESKASQYRRDSSGAMALDRVTSATTTKNPDGTSTTTSIEDVRDVNGSLQPVQKTLETVVASSPTEKQITTQIQRFDHADGQFAVVARERATVDTTGSNTTRTERIIQQPDGAGWKDTGKVITTETRQPDGTLQRETIEQGQTLYSKLAAPPMNVEPLVAQRKIVEREAHNPDGTVVIQRDVFVRDVNGDWKPQSFSTEAATEP